MSHRAFRMRITSLGVLIALAGCGSSETATDPDAAIASLSQHHGTAAEATRLVELRQLTARFQYFDRAYNAGYDTRITPCWEHATQGAMGYHWGNPDLIDATAELLSPEVLMYEPQAGGHLKLVGMEYIVPIEAWQGAGHDPNDPNDRPELLGQKFTQHSFLPIYKLHIWLWRQNPAGTFKDWNPQVSCDRAEEKETF